MGVIMLNIKIILIVDGKLILKPNMLNMNVGEVKQTVKILLWKRNDGASDVHF